MVNLRFAAWFAVLAVAVWALLALGPLREREEYVLEIAADGGGPVLRLPIRAGAPFELSYVHSSELVPVKGTFLAVGPARIQVESSSSTSFGPGLPFDPEAGTWEFDEGWMTLTDIGVELQELALLISPGTSQTITAGGKDYVLERTFPPGSRVRIRVKER